MVNIESDLRAFGLVDALLTEDSAAIEILCSDPTPELVAEMVRTLACALTQVLETNLGTEGALQQVALWRAQFLERADV